MESHAIDFAFINLTSATLASLIYFIYGLAFFMMGVVVLIYPRQGSEHRLARIIPFIAGFGIFHGINEWIEGFFIARDMSRLTELVNVLTITLSYWFLFEFGRKLFMVCARERCFSITPIRFLFRSWVSPVIVALTFAAAFAGGEFTHGLEVSANFLLCLPGSLMSGAGFILYFRCNENKLSDFNVKRWFYTLGVLFLFYALLALLSSKRGVCLLFNGGDTSPVHYALLPEKVLRTVVAIVVAYFILKILGIFNRERILKIENAVAKLTNVNFQLKKEISERLRSEETLRRYHYIVSASHELMSLIDRNYVYLTVNDIYRKVHGMEYGDIVGKSVSELIGAGVFETFVKGNLDRCLKGETVNYQAWFEFRGVGRRYMDVYYYPFYLDDGTVDGVVMVSRDKTEQRVVEDAIVRSADTMRSMIDAVTESLLLVDTDGRVLAINETAARRLNKNKNELMGTRIFDILPPDVAAKRKKNIDDVIATGKLMQFEDIRNGVHYLHRIYPLFDQSGKVDRVTIFAIDINERKAYEASIISVAKFPDENPNPVFRVSKDLLITCANKSSLKANIIRDICEPCSIDNVGRLTLSARWRVDIEEVLSSGMSKDIEIEIDNRYFHFTVAPVSEIDSVNVYGYDITMRKQAEEDLRESEQRFRTAVTDAPIPIMLHAEDGEVILVSSAWTEISGYAHEEFPTMSEWLRKAHGERADYVDNTRIKKLFYLDGRQIIGEDSIITKGGDVRIWDFSAAPIGRTRDGRRMVISMAMDITDRKIAEDQLKTSLEEKEILIREIHHRVKNNLMVISSLIGLQLESIEDARYRGVFREIQNRVKSMSLVHEKLYQSKGLARIDFKDYVTGLSSELAKSILMEDGRISVEVDMEGVYLGIDTAIPCGLIINELLSNSFKYAFPDRRNGCVYIRIRRLDGQIELVAGDDGVGIPPEIDPAKTKTLGLHIVDMLVKQIRGSIELVRGAGTEFRIKFNAGR